MHFDGRKGYIQKWQACCVVSDQPLDKAFLWSRLLASFGPPQTRKYTPPTAIVPHVFQGG